MTAMPAYQYPNKELPEILAFFFNQATNELGLGLVKVLSPFRPDPLLRIPSEDIQDWIQTLDAVKDVSITDLQGDSIPQFVEGLTSALLEYSQDHNMNLWERLIGFMTMSILTDKLGGADSEQAFIQAFSPPIKDSTDKSFDTNSNPKVNYDDHIQDLLIHLVGGDANLVGGDANIQPAGPLALQFFTNDVLMPKRGIAVIKGQKEKILTDYLNLRNSYEASIKDENSSQSPPSVSPDWSKNRCYNFILNQYAGTKGAQLEPRPGMSLGHRVIYALGGDMRKLTTAAIFRIVLILLCTGLTFAIIARG